MPTVPAMPGGCWILLGNGISVRCTLPASRQSSLTQAARSADGGGTMIALVAPRRGYRVTSASSIDRAILFPAAAFLYAFWRDFVWDRRKNVVLVAGVGFLYALWRDFVWDALMSPSMRLRFYTPFGVTLFGTSTMLEASARASSTFLYALWRDFVWDPTSSGGVVACADAVRSAGGTARGRNSLVRTARNGCLRWSGILRR